VVCKHYNTKLTLSELLNHFVEIKDVMLISGLLKHFAELLTLLLRVEVEDAELGPCEHYFDRVKCDLEVLSDEGLALLHENICEAVHHLTLLSVLFLVAEEFLALDHSPVLLELLLRVANIAECFDKTAFTHRASFNETVEHHNSRLWLSHCLLRLTRLLLRFFLVLGSEN
jgi:hypothetical protein